MQHSSSPHQHFLKFIRKNEEKTQKSAKKQTKNIPLSRKPNVTAVPLKLETPFINNT